MSNIIRNTLTIYGPLDAADRIAGRIVRGGMEAFGPIPSTASPAHMHMDIWAARLEPTAAATAEEGEPTQDEIEEVKADLLMEQGDEASEARDAALMREIDSRERERERCLDGLHTVSQRSDEPTPYQIQEALEAQAEEDAQAYEDGREDWLAEVNEFELLMGYRTPIFEDEHIIAQEGLSIRRRLAAEKAAAKELDQSEELDRLVSEDLALEAATNWKRADKHMTPEESKKLETEDEEPCDERMILQEIARGRTEPTDLVTPEQAKALLKIDDDKELYRALDLLKDQAAAAYQKELAERAKILWPKIERFRALGMTVDEARSAAHEEFLAETGIDLRSTVTRRCEIILTPEDIGRAIDATVG